MDGLTLALQILATIKASGVPIERAQFAMRIADELLSDVKYSGEWPEPLPPLSPSSAVVGHERPF